MMVARRKGGEVQIVSRGGVFAQVAKNCGPAIGRDLDLGQSQGHNFRSLCANPAPRGGIFVNRWPDVKPASRVNSDWIRIALVSSRPRQWDDVPEWN